MANLLINNDCLNSCMIKAKFCCHLSNVLFNQSLESHNLLCFLKYVNKNLVETVCSSKDRNVTSDHCYGKKRKSVYNSEFIDGKSIVVHMLYKNMLYLDSVRLVKMNTV